MVVAIYSNNHKIMPEVPPMKGLFAIQNLLGAALLTLGAPASASSIMDWNDAMLSAIRTSGTAPPMAARNMAIVSTAIYDAVNGIKGGYTPYAVSAGAPGGGSNDMAAAAAAQAAYTTLSQLYTGIDFSATYQAQLGTITNGQAKTDGMNWGSTVATTILNNRSNDNSTSAASTPYTVSSEPGRWQPTPHSNPGLNLTTSPLLPGWGNVTPFAVSSVSSLAPGGPPALTSTAYTTAYNEVFTLGAALGSSRTLDQTHIAKFWAAGAGTSTPSGMWNEVAQTLASSAGLDMATEARLMAALNVAMADAGIVAWEAKYEADFWRPISAIANGDMDGNLDTVGDPMAGFGGWSPLLDTPPFPEYVSGHSAFSAAAAEILAAYFGENVEFSIASDINGDGSINDLDATYDKNGDGFINVLDAYRSFTSFDDAAQEAGMSRIYGGIHFSVANEDGQTVGREVAMEVNQNYFLPVAVPEPSSALMLTFGALLSFRRRRF
jgi:hypothetical protein